MQRRLFLQASLAVPFLSSSWKKGPPPSYLEEVAMMMRAASVPGVVFGALRDFEVAWIAPLGVQEARTDRKVTRTTLFQAASLTKQITAHAAILLQAQGKLDLDRPLVSWVDDLPNDAAKTVTPRHVLSHSSGFRNWRFAETGKPLPDLVPSFPPGTKYGYSGEGYVYLQRVMERITGLAFGQIAQDLVLGPLQMKSSTLVWDPATLDTTALPHDRSGEVRAGWDKPARALRSWAERNGKTVLQLRYEDSLAVAREAGAPAIPVLLQPNAAASLVTHAEDYARFLAGALHSREIGKQQIAINEFLGWGLGWSIERAAGRTYVWQWGDNPGFKNIVMADPATGSAIFAFTNGDGGARPRGHARHRA